MGEERRRPTIIKWNLSEKRQIIFLLLHSSSLTSLWLGLQLPVVHLSAVHCLGWLAGGLVSSSYPRVVVQDSGVALEKWILSLCFGFLSAPLAGTLQKPDPTSRGKWEPQKSVAQSAPRVALTPPPAPASDGPWAAELHWRSSSGVPAGSRRGSGHLWGGEQMNLRVSFAPQLEPSSHWHPEGQKGRFAGPKKSFERKQYILSRSTHIFAAILW